MAVNISILIFSFKVTTVLFLISVVFSIGMNLWRKKIKKELIINFNEHLNLNEDAFKSEIVLCDTDSSKLAS
jgi:hypothetical protein